MSTQPSRPEPVSGWATGGAAFAAAILVVVGAFEVIAGLAAIFNDEFFVVTRNYTFDLDVTVWGWFHLILGVGLLAVGIGIFSRKTWAVVTGGVLAMFSAVLNFFFIPFYPFWAIVLIALDVWVIWALTRPGLTEDWD